MKPLRRNNRDEVETYANVKNEWSYMSIPLYDLILCIQANFHYCVTQVQGYIMSFTIKLKHNYQNTKRNTYFYFMLEVHYTISSIY
jgi:hypothetical protein